MLDRVCFSVYISCNMVDFNTGKVNAMGEIIEFKQKPKPKPKPTELEKAADDVVYRLEYLLDGLDHIDITVGILLVGRDKSSIDIKIDNQTKKGKKLMYEPGANEKLNEALNKRKDK